MGKKDITTKLLTKDNAVFAELFNKFLFNEDFIDPAKLKEQDTTELVANAEKAFAGQKFRDVLKIAEVRTDGKLAYLLLGIENQAHIHYAMVVRKMLYDAMNYAGQVMEIGKEVHKKPRNPYTDAEWLSGFPKDGTLIPVITLVVCWNPDQWDGPKSLYEMIDPNIVKQYGEWFDNCRLNLISVHDVPDELLQSTETEIGLAMEFSKYSNNKEKIKAYQNDTRFLNRSNEFIATINAMTDTNFELSNNGGESNMCEGLRLLLEETAEEATKKATKDAQDELIKSFFQMMRAQYPETPVAQTIKIIAKACNRTQKSVRLLIQ